MTGENTAEKIDNVSKSELNDLLDAESNKATKVRIAWSIGGKQGHGEWHDLTDIDHLQQTVVDMNKKYGSGTHLLNYNI